MISVDHFVRRELDQDVLLLCSIILDERIHADDIHAVLPVVGQEVLVQVHRRNTLNKKIIFHLKLCYHGSHKCKCKISHFTSFAYNFWNN
jgi:hypothetical protein